MDINLPYALLLTTFAGLSTGIGSIIAWFIKKPNYSWLSVMLGFSAGVMVYVSFAELLKTAVEDIGFGLANLTFFGGILFIGIIDMLVPHNYEEEYIGDSAFVNTPHEQRGLTATGTGVKGKSTLMRAGLFTALGIAIHNFPEGLVTFSSAATGNASLGLAIAVAVAIHNIPEGIAVSMPIYYATGSRKKAFLYSFSSGLAEPVGAFIGFLVLRPFLTESILSGMLGFVAGIMVYISLDELLPLAHQYGKEHQVIIGTVLGMAVMAVSLYFLV
jgi:ZIP family zinc transporter